MVAIPVNCKKAEKSSTVFFVQKRHREIEEYWCSAPVAAPSHRVGVPSYAWRNAEGRRVRTGDEVARCWYLP